MLLQCEVVVDGIASGRMGYLMCADFLQAQEAKDTAGQKMQQAKK